MKKKKLGIPRSMTYYRYGTLWHNFFECLGLNVVLSPETNKEIINLGNKYMPSSPIAEKIYNGHIIYLSSICDYILINDYKNNKVLSYGFELIINESQIIKININSNSKFINFISLSKVGLKFTKNPLKIIVSYLIASKKQGQYNITKINEQKNKISKNNIKILIASEYYNLQDKYIIEPIINYLKNNDVICIFTSNIPSKEAINFSEYFPNEINNTIYKELIGAIYYYQHQVNGLVNLIDSSTFSYTEIISITNIPNIIIDINKCYDKNYIESSLESLLDIIKNKV